MPIGFIEINLRGEGKAGEVYTLYGETHHLHYQSMFVHLAGPISQKHAFAPEPDLSGIASQRDVIQATMLMQRHFVLDPESPAQKELRELEFENAFSSKDQVEFVNHHLCLVSAHIELVFSCPKIKRTISALADKLYSHGDFKMNGAIATEFIDGKLGEEVNTIAPADWFVTLCRNNPEFGWNLETETAEWEAIRNAPPYPDQSSCRRA
jgi:hypothetical protein